MALTMAVTLSFATAVALGGFNNAETGIARSADGVPIAYQVSGTGDTSLVFVHGWSCDRAYWSAQVAKFSSTFRVITVDLAGHGESGTRRKTWTMQAFGADIAAVMDHLALNRVILVGHSAAGFSILEAARLRPKSVTAIIGVDAYRNIRRGYFDRKYSKEEIQAMALPLQRDFKGEMTTLVRKSFFLPDANPDLVNWVAADMAAAPPAVAIPSMQAYYEYRNEGLQAALVEVGSRVPIIAINAARSQIDPSVFQAFAPGFSVSYVNGVGHFLMMEQPDVFNSELARVIHGLAR